MYNTSVMFHLFQLLIYQPFLNLLVGIYWLLSLIPGNKPDMGVAVVIFTIAIRLLLLPLTIAGDRSEKERREIEGKVKDIQDKFATQPLEMDVQIKKTFKSNPRIVFSEILDLGIQIAIALMLWRIFANGLPGADLHLIYSWMPEVQLPFNLVFLGKFDLSHPHMVLNLLQSLLIFVLESINILSSPYPVSRKDVVRLQLTLPIVSFLIFMFLPAGKKLFVITTLSFSIVYTLIRVGLRWYHAKFPPQEEVSVAAPETVKPTEPIPPEQHKAGM